MELKEPVKDGLCCYYFLCGQHFSEIALKAGAPPLLTRDDNYLYMDENLFDEYFTKMCECNSRYVSSGERLEINETAFIMYMELVLSTHAQRYRRNGGNWEDIVFEDTWT